MGMVGTAPYQGIDLSHDGTRVAVHHHAEGTRGGDIFVIDLARNNTPDGRWIAYTSGAQVWVQSYPIPGTKYLAADGAALPRWRADGLELFATARVAGRVWSVAVSATGRGLTLGAPELLFDRRFFSGSHVGPRSNTNSHTYAVSADGQRILAPRQPALDSTRPAVTVIVNWMALLGK
jgi:hypothetical protein